MGDEIEDLKKIIAHLTVGPEATIETEILAVNLAQLKVMNDLLRSLDILNSNLVRLYYLIEEELYPPRQKSGGE